MNRFAFVFIFLISLHACKSKEPQYDASGVFEADEIIVSAEANGKILSFNLNEGDVVKKGNVVGAIEDLSLNLQKDQLKSTIQALYQKQNSASPQISIIEEQINTQQANVATFLEQLNVLKKEQSRIANLVKADAVPSKQLDDINGQVSILNQQIKAAQSQITTLQQQIKSAKSTVDIQNKSILSERSPIEKKLSQLDDQIKKCIIQNPLDGTVLTKYMKVNEVAVFGKPLYKIANVEQLILRIYVTGNQLNQIKIGQKLKIFTGQGKTLKTTEGSITWISSAAEFTPKTIQTVDERSNLVYAVKVLVPNDGFIKIGMYGDVKF